MNEPIQVSKKIFPSTPASALAFTSSHSHFLRLFFSDGEEPVEETVNERKVKSGKVRTNVYEE